MKYGIMRFYWGFIEDSTRRVSLLLLKGEKIVSHNMMTLLGVFMNDMLLL